MAVLGVVALVIIGVLLAALVPLWLYFQNDPFDQGGANKVLWREFSSLILGGAALALVFLGFWIAQATGLW